MLSKSLVLSLLFTSSNILCTIANLKGEVIYWTSVGTYKNKGTKKITSTSLTSVIKLLTNYLENIGCAFLHIRLKGLRKNKKMVLKYFKTSSLNILSICDNTSLPHNGCKKQKIRRL